MILQPLGILVQDVRILGSVIDIVGEEDSVHAAVEVLFRWTKENHFWFCPVCNPIGNNLGGCRRGGFGSSLLCRHLETRQKDHCDHGENKSAFHRFPRNFRFSDWMNLKGPAAIFAFMTRFGNCRLARSWTNNIALAWS